jgi:hypothetical protein
MHRPQFPIKLAFAMNKSQDQTLERVGIDLPKHVFAYGEFCVAVSRTGDVRGTRMSIVFRWVLPFLHQIHTKRFFLNFEFFIFSIFC